MKGGNFYNQHSSWQRAAMDPAEPLMLKAAASLASNLASSGAVVVLGDLGCSQGANSQHPVSLIIEELQRASKRKLGGDLCVQVFHVDQPSNDFNSLFSVLSQSDLSYQRKFPQGVYSYAEGKSFHESLFPPGTAHLIMTYCALHWISEKPDYDSISFTSTAKRVSQKDRQGIWGFFSLLLC